MAPATVGLAARADAAAALLRRICSLGEEHGAGGVPAASAKLAAAAEALRMIDGEHGELGSEQRGEFSRSGEAGDTALSPML